MTIQLNFVSYIVSAQEKSGAVTNKERLDRINALDLSAIKEYLFRHFSWSRNVLDETGAEYRKFLFLVGKYGPDLIVPWNKNILSFWKVHILHTRKYFEDCQWIFGFYFHYDPSMTGLFKHEASQGNPSSVFSKTLEFYAKEYSETPVK